MHRDDPLDLVRENIETGHQDHVLLAVNDAYIAMIVHDADIAAAKSAISGHRPRCFRRAVPVAGHDLRPGDAYLTGLTDRQLAPRIIANGDHGRGQRQADRTVVFLQVDGIDSRCRGGFRETVGLDQGAAGDLLPALGNDLLHRHSATDGELQAGKIQLCKVRVVEQRVEQGVHTGEHGELVLCQFLDKSRYVARVGDEHVATADAHHFQAIGGQRKDMIKRQRGDDHLRLALDKERTDPGGALLKVGEQVAMHQRGALGHACGAPGVLQKRHVLLVDIDFFQVEAPTLRDHIIEAHGACQVKAWHHFFHMAQHKIDQQTLDAKHVAKRSQYHLLDGGARDDLFQYMGKIFEYHNGFSARVLELMLEFSRRIKRIDVDHDIAGPQRAEYAHRILQAVWHHQGDARTTREAARLHPGAESGGEMFKLAKADRLAHVAVSGPVAELRTALFEQVAD